jgi:hypothetical protein
MQSVSCEGPYEATPPMMMISCTDERVAIDIVVAVYIAIHHLVYLAGRIELYAQDLGNRTCNRHPVGAVRRL